MKLKKLIAGMTAIASFAIAVCFIGGKQTEVNAATINSIAKQNSYVGTSFLYKILATENIKYNKFYTSNKITYRKGKPEGVVVHETADPGATAHDEAIYFNREWDKMYAYVHAFVDKNTVIQMMTPDYGVWGAGPIANERFVQVELCEEDNRDDFAKSVNNDAIYLAKILHRYDLTPTNATHDGKGTVWSHAAVSKFLGGTDHGDPDGYFAKWGYSMDDFFDLIKNYYDLQAAKPKTSKKTKKVDPATNIVSLPKAKKGQKILMHDAVLYDSKGKKIKGKKLKTAGTAVNILGRKTIGKTAYYQISKTQYINAANIDGTLRLLKHNSYLYDTVGVKTGVSKLLKGNSVRTYGSPIQIAGESYYAVGATQFVKTSNF